MAFVGRSDTADPGAQQDQQDRQAHRRERLYADDGQFRVTRPSDSVAEAARAPGLRIAEIMATVLEGYGDRPALAQRARELRPEPDSGRMVLNLLPEFESITYRELWARVRTVAAEWHEYGLKPGDFVCVLGFASIDYTVIKLACVHLGAVVVPLQAGAPAGQHAPILTETQPRVLAVGMDYLDTAVEAALAGTPPKRLVVFDYEPRDDNQRAAFDAARERLARAGSGLVVETFDDTVERGSALPRAPLYRPRADEDPLAWVFYTSGSTGTPKGAMLTESLCRTSWLAQSDQPVITLSYMPMSHLMGYGYVIMTLANGGISYFTARSDLSTLFEDLSLARPTTLSLVPRVCEMFYQDYLSELDRRVLAGADPDHAGKQIKADIRENVLGGRVLAVGCGSASLAPEIKAFMDDVLDQHLLIGYSSTEIAGGMILADGYVLRPPVVDYRLDDVPELGYFTTDTPYPRGELLLKTTRFMAGYYKRPDLTATMFDAEGYYRTGDIMAQVGPDRLEYVDRRNNVQKLSQGEFVAVSRLEALYSKSPVIRQIFVYGNSARAFLLAVVVPAEELAAELGTDEGRARVKAAIKESLQQIAKENKLNGYEVPREFLVEAEPFSVDNGLLSGVGKFLRPKLKDRYGEPLEQLYAQLADDQIRELRALRAGGAQQPVLSTVARAVRATLGLSEAVGPDATFAELGGDSLSALTFSKLLEDVFGVEVPVGVVVDPTGDVRSIATYVERRRDPGPVLPTFATVHGTDTAEIEATSLRLDKFIDADILDAAPTLPRPGGDVRTVLLTGTTGFLGRFLGLAWLQRLAELGGTLICIARGADATQARHRIETALETDPALLQQFRMLADNHLEILAGDIGERRLGLDGSTWDRLADGVDLIVHAAAHVNHVLPYKQLFGPNVAGTAELIRLAVTAKLKRFHYVSTMGIASITDHIPAEDCDIRTDVSYCIVNDSYANGYGISKWASEVLLRGTHDLCGLPVAVFRPGMILADSRYDGQLNVPDIFTRLLYSIAVTGIAPRSFYRGNSQDRPRAHYEGLPVDFIAQAVVDVGASVAAGFHTFNISNPHEDGISLDSFVDWIAEAGYPVRRIDEYQDWLMRFETAMRALPEDRRQASVLAVLDVYRYPAEAVDGSLIPSKKFQTAVSESGREIPHVSADLIEKYIAGLQQHGLLS